MSNYKKENHYKNKLPSFHIIKNISKTANIFRRNR